MFDSTVCRIALFDWNERFGLCACLAGSPLSLERGLEHVWLFVPLVFLARCWVHFTI